MIRLIHRTDCPFCWKVRIALFELGVDFTETVVELGEKNREVSNLNPNGTVPVMITDEDQVIWESAAMAEYIAESFGGERLLSGSAANRARIRQLHIYSDGSLGKAVFPLVRARRTNPGGDIDRDVLRECEELWRDCLVILEKEIRGRTWFGGEEFSLADCALVPRFTLAEVYGLAVPEEFAEVADWYRRASGRASVLRARPKVFPGVDDLIN